MNPDSRPKGRDQDCTINEQHKAARMNMLLPRFWPGRLPPHSSRPHGLFSAPLARMTLVATSRHKARPAKHPPARLLPFHHAFLLIHNMSIIMTPL